MSDLIYSMGVSLDGFIAGPGGEITGRRPTRSCIGSTTSRRARPAVGSAQRLPGGKLAPTLAVEVSSAAACSGR
jgi:hypothetical protein